MSVFDWLARIRRVTWTWNDQAGAVGLEPGRADAGVIAQDVEAVYPELVTTGPGDQASELHRARRSAD